MGIRRKRTHVVAPSGREYLIGSVPLAAAEWGDWGLLRVDVTEVGEGRVYLEQVPDTETLAVRMEQLGAGIQTGSWIPPDVPAETKAHHHERQVRREARRAWEETYPLAAVTKRAVQTALIAIVVAVITLIEPTPDLSDVGRALVVVMAISSIDGVLYALSIQRNVSRKSP
jgi:hypothetical protein